MSTGEKMKHVTGITDRSRIAVWYCKKLSVYKYTGSVYNLFIIEDIKIYYDLRITCSVKIYDFLLYVILTPTHDYSKLWNILCC